MDLANIYYREVVGVYPFPTQKEEVITRCTIAYLLESGVSEPEILDMLMGLGKKGYVEPKDIPDSIWEGSLTERDHYYCHHALQLISPDPIVGNDGTFKQYPFYQEMKARFTMNDLIDYFYQHNSSYEILRDDKRDAGQFKHMLQRYSSFDKIEPLDFVLFMIDEAFYQRLPMTDPFSIKSAAIETIVADRLRHIIDDRHAKGYDKITWRTYLVEEGEITWQQMK